MINLVMGYSGDILTTLTKGNRTVLHLGKYGFLLERTSDMVYHGSFVVSFTSSINSTSSSAEHRKYL